MMSIQEKSKENSSSVIKKSEDKNLETQIQGSQTNLAKKSGPKETIKSLVKSSSESKINQSELGTCMSTRSSKAASSDKKASKSINKNMVTLKGHSQQESTKKKKLPQKKSVHGTPKSNEQLNRRSQRLQQLTEVSTRSLRNREIQGQVQAAKQSLPPRKEHCNNTQSKSNKVKTSQKHVKRKVLEIKSDTKEDENLVINEVINSPKGKKRKVEHQTAYTCSSQCMKGSEKCLQKNTRKEETKSVPVTSELKRSKTVTSAVSKKNEMKKSVHTQVNISAKSQKSPQPSVPEQSVDSELEQAGKSKRGSILQLCEEIAGEIESDTVEVKKESSQMESVKEEKPTEIKLEEANNERQILHQKETSQDVQCNRFFPSRKTKPVKCILNGINSSAKKNSNWTKIKLSKFNSVQQNKLDSQVSPKLGLIQTSFSLPALEMHHPATQSIFLGTKPHDDKNIACQQEEIKEINSKEVKVNDVTVEINKTTKRASENCHLDNQIKPPPDPPLDNQMKDSFESTPDKNFSLCLESKLQNNLVGNTSTVSASLSQAKIDTGENKFPGLAPKQHTILSNQTSQTSDNRETPPNQSWPKCNSHLEITIPKDLKLREAEKVDQKQLIIDAGQKRFGAVSCNVCGMLYTASNPEDETQHLLFHNQFISAVKYVGWKKERILAEYPDGRIIMVLPEDPKYALKKVDEIREMVDNDLGFQQAPLMCYSRTKTLLFISNDKKVVGCLIAEHIQWGYRVIEEKLPVIRSEEEKVRFERQKAWCCSTLPEPAICGISRIWVFSMMRRKKIASRMIECLRSNFIYGSYLSKEEIAFSDPTPDGKLFATQYCGTGQFLVYNFINGQNNT
ncbi:N-acetyltransferase ESCO1 isoform X1 [Suricata suricatta]|uniref:Establishment of sister chromatid cohesion N-acetyltransferase 1 n=1 Tax=Suricata suricatta TaxID=37032 RepID=A0A673USU4_SURSU|nr:N-acetyltransferase ESCO1 isoform X1 [Suricata suricatta]XP_029778851.1 N-acetyltransferase ESCO1 isoform X1 [Suricata suricatta]XP_029778852.1 N-acetyltransferase ESCO1 isoform X1 [Suricata suricatta]XP_029778853.1 N-acetyltransferase ESCO1 isoform X1 [Suricata suricatta]XP_029778854.1 N-acetyltransferase ESCO1 isoform X1 [Suricata suricatta]XP_029778855.1 N-acetyltransferase ESCO1 isoform X1 [Suricata suricatta]